MNWTSEQLAERIAGNPSLKIRNNPLSPKAREKRGEAPTQRVEPSASVRYSLATIRVVIPGPPVSKPRQTKADKWKQRPSVMRYRAWADLARKCAGELPITAGNLSVRAYFPLPKSGKKLLGRPHTVRPDSDNVLKACADALFPANDAMIHEMKIIKRWDDGNGPRVEITVR